MRWPLLCLILVANLFLSSAGAAQADGELPPCEDTASGNLSLLGCGYTQAQLLAAMHGGVSTQTQYRVHPLCREMQAQPNCINQVQCDDPPNTFKYSVDKRVADGPWTYAGTVCLDESGEDLLRVLSVRRVLREFKRLKWDPAVLVIQPPEGETLVNFPTNFYTTTTGPALATITLLGSEVEIEARPVSYVWHFGDGETTTTQEPGAAFVEGRELEITHEYLESGITVKARVDVTYAGRFRIDHGAWTDLDDTLTVRGNSAALRIRSATPHLV